MSRRNDIVYEESVYKYAINTETSYPYYVAKKLGLAPVGNTEIPSDAKFWPIAYNAFSTKAMLGLMGLSNSIFADDALHKTRTPNERYNVLYDCYGNGESYIDRDEPYTEVVKDGGHTAVYKDIPELLKTATLVTIQLGMGDVVYKLQTDAEMALNKGVDVSDIKAVASLVAGLIKNYETYYKEWVNSYKTLMKEVKSYTSEGGAKVVLVGIMNPVANVMISDEVLLPLGAAFNLMTDRMNSVIKECAEENGFIYIDISNVDTPASSKAKHLTVQSFVDMMSNTEAIAIATHPTKEGYEQIGRMIVAAIDEELAKEEAGEPPVSDAAGTDIKLDLGRFNMVHYVMLDGKRVPAKDWLFSSGNHVLNINCDKSTAKNLTVAVLNNEKKITVMTYSLKYDEKNGYTAKRFYVTNDAVGDTVATAKTIKSTVASLKTAIKSAANDVFSLIKEKLAAIDLTKFSY